MKKLFWCVQQLNYKGGAEQVSINLANHLADKYDITIVSTAKIIGEISYKIDPRIKVESLNVPIDVVKIDYFTKLYLDNKKICKFFGLIFRFFFHFILIQHIYRRKMSNITKKELTIASSLDCEIFAPFKGRYLIHYHFSSDNYLHSFDRFFMFFCRRPEKTIFLSEGIYNEVVGKLSHLENKTYIDNLCRFEAVENVKFYNNKIISVGRYSEQKNPMLTLKVAKELKDRNIQFSLDMFGDGPYEEEMLAYIEENNLTNVILHNPSNTIENEFIKSDILLLTSLYEGSPLVINEAKSFSVIPVCVPYKGDKSMIINGIDGYLSKSFDEKEIADIIEPLLLSKDKIINVKKQVFKSISSINAEKIIAKWISLIGD